MYHVDKIGGQAYAYPMAKIYTKTGDSGSTGLLGGKRVPKNNVRVEAYGTVDEANAVIGFILSRFDYFTHHDELKNAQHMLFDVGAMLASPEIRKARPNETDVAHLEQLIDELWEPLPPLTAFILPGGSELGALLHIARNVVRRAERRAITVHQLEPLPPSLIAYLNRLSDYLFALARTINAERGITETPWHSQG